jgi:KUP system potassium uptake protein
MAGAVLGAAKGTHGGLPAAATLGALGIVYGDIGTSPLYAFKEAVRATGPGGAHSAATILGILSLILWALLIIISLKYAILILRADNKGEGGIVALLALLDAREAPARSWRAALLVVGLVGAALLYGDGAITPAISVLSAVEGLKVDAPRLAHFVVPITVVILVGLFYMQSKGTGFIGGIFGPVMLTWFAVIALLGIASIAHHPEVLWAANPFHAVHYLATAPFHVSFGVLGAVFLAVTGGEAMYADMGHFGRLPIRLAWFTIVLPALALNYLGQGALLLAEPSAADNPFFQLAPDWAQYALVLFATLAAVIASQAIISGVFSLTRQGIQLGFLPLMKIEHTASHERGQIYIPVVNWTLAAATLIAVVGFGSSDALAGAYGIAVSLLMAITTVLAALVAIKWGYSIVAVLCLNGAFLVVDLIFLAANGTKLLEGGWFPLLLSLVVTFVMLTWRRGQILSEVARRHLREDETTFFERLRTAPPIRRPGSAAFLSSAMTGIPLPLSHHLKHNGVLQENVLLVCVQMTEEPRVARSERAWVIPLEGGISRVCLRFGFMEDPNIPDGIAAAIADGCLDAIDPAAMTYYIGRETVLPTRKVPGMAVWREGCFSLIQRNAERTAAYFCIPAAQVFEIGFEVEI